MQKQGRGTARSAAAATATATATVLQASSSVLKPAVARLRKLRTGQQDAVDIIEMQDFVKSESVCKQQLFPKPRRVN